MSLAKQLIILVIVAAGGVALWFTDVPALLVSSDSAVRPNAGRAMRNSAAPVITKSVELVSEATVVQAPGTGIAVKSVTLFPESEGRVTEILFSAGSKVGKGEALLRLDDRAEQLGVQLARVHVTEARRKLDRMRKLAPRGNVARSELELAETALSAVRIELAQREHALDERTLIAPFAGVTGIPQVDPGERVSDTSPVTTLDDRSTILVDFEVPEAYARGVRSGAAIDITAWAAGQKRFTGTVEAIASQVDAVTRTLRVRAAVSNKDDLLRPGMSFVVRMPLQGDSYPSVPSVAVLWDRQGAYVWRIRGGKAQQVRVRIRKRTEDAVLVEAPLVEGDSVVVEGVQRMRKGKAVRVLPEEAAMERRARG